MAIHDVDVDRGDPGRLDGFDLVAQPTKVACQNGGQDRWPLAAQLTGEFRAFYSAIHRLCGV
jgi:hypothetical protein